MINISRNSYSLIEPSTANGYLPMKTATFLALLALASSQPARAQQDDTTFFRPISLPAALEQALDRNADLRIAEARSEIAASQARRTSSPLWPAVSLEAGLTRSNDPVFAFGTKLRQGRFSQADFDIDALNSPDPLSDWSTAIGARWSILDPTLWAGRAAARGQAEAARWSTERTRQATEMITRTLYYRAIAAESSLEAARAAEEAARATVDAFASRRQRGLLTEADLLQAEAELAAARAQATAARAVRLDALQDLGRHLGWGADTLPQPVDSLAAPELPADSGFDPEARPDLRALAAHVAAAGAARRQARLSFIPALDAFAKYSTHSEDPGFGSDDWTIGLMLRWPLFTGFGRAADVQRTTAERRAARIQYDESIRDAEAELDQAERAVSSARQQVEAMRAAAEAAGSGRDLMRRRFEEGLATASDLLQAEARATEMRQRAIGALANFHMAVARLDFVRSQSD